MSYIQTYTVLENLALIIFAFQKFMEPFLSQEFIDTASVAMETVSKQVGFYMFNNSNVFGM